MTGRAPISASEPRVCAVARDPLVREGLARLIEACALSLAPIDAADVALLDASNAGQISGIRVPCVVLASEDARAPELLSAGAAAVLRRDVGPDRLRTALIAVNAGLVVLDAALARTALPDASVEADVGEELSPRERQVLTLLASGLSNRKIAERLEISEHTAKFHVVSILAKLGAATRTEAVVIAARKGLLWL
jgi:two-component system nitrate/nitrite response regulator NarL